MIEVLSLTVWPLIVIFVVRSIQQHHQTAQRHAKELAKYEIEIRNNTAIGDLKGRIDALDAKIVSIQNGLQWTK
jgi:hypothetical protein